MDNIENPPERVGQFRGHKAYCTKCKEGVVKMARSRTTLLLEPDNCSCLACGQQYYYTKEKLTKTQLQDLDMKFWDGDLE